MSEPAASISRWNSADGRRVLSRLAKREASLEAVRSELRLPDWEYEHLRRTVRALRKRAGLLRVLAEKMEIFRELAEPNKLKVSRLEQRDFRGSKAHLDRLLTGVQAPTDKNPWNTWRESARTTTPDLRGANLSGLDLRYVRLDNARLADADLSASTIRGGRLARAVLRGCSLRHADLTYSDLRFTKLEDTVLDHTLLTDANLTGADLRRAILLGTVMNRANLRGANLRGSLVWGASVWDVEYDEKTRQEGLKISWGGLDPFETYTTGDALRVQECVQVDNLEVAHFISLLMKNPRIGTILDAASSKVVLLLGRFLGKERAVLGALQEALPRYGYCPIVFDFPKLKDRDTIETVATLAGMSRFVIANLSQPRSTPLEAHLIIPNIAVAFVPIIRAGERPFSMFEALRRKYAWVLPTVTYRSERHLIRLLKERIVEPCESMSNSLRALKHPQGATKRR